MTSAGAGKAGGKASRSVVDIAVSVGSMPLTVGRGRPGSHRRVRRDGVRRPCARARCGGRRLGPPVAEALAHTRGAGRVVVLDAAVLDGAVVVDERVRGARVAVERHADRAGVDQLDAAGARGGTGGGCGRRSAAGRSRRRAARPRRRPARGGTSARRRRGEPWQTTCRRRARSRQRGELGRERLAERLAAGRHRARDDRVVGRVVRVAVQRSPLPRIHTASASSREPLDGLAGQPPNSA